MAPPPPARHGYGGAFVELLAELGYDRGDLSAEMFDALFALPSMRVQAFLEWFLSRITPRHSVARQLSGADDFAIYAALLSGSMGQQPGLLSGDELAAQERACHADAQQDESLDALLAQNAGLEREIAQLEAQLQRVSSKNDKITKMVQRRTVQSDMHSRSGVQSQFGAEREHFSEPLAALHEMELRNLDEMKSRVASVVLGTPDSQSHGGTLALTGGAASHASQNGEHAAAVAHQQQQQPPSWLHDADPSTLQLHEQDALIYNRCSLELARLEKAYAIGEQDALLARMQLAKNESLWRQLSESKRSLYQQYELMSPSAVSVKRQKLLASIEATKHELARFVHHVLPTVFDEMAFLRSTTILLGSYEQKLWRQEHRFLKLRALLDAFDHQHGRLKFVHRLLDAEWEDLVAVDAILSSFFKDVEADSAQIQARLTAQSASSFTASNGGSQSKANSRSSGGTRLSIPDADQVAHALYDYMQHSVESRHQHQAIDNVEMDGAARRHSFRLRTFEELVRLCDQQRADDASIADSLAHAEQQWLELYNTKRKGFLALRKELFGDSMSSTPVLLPQNLSMVLQEAVEAKEQTEQELHAALETLRMKKRELTMDPSRRQQQDDTFARLKQELEARGKLHRRFP